MTERAFLTLVGLRATLDGQRASQGGESCENERKGTLLGMDAM